MKRLIFLLIIIIVWGGKVTAQPLDRVIQSLPLFVGWANVKAVEGILTIGVFSDSQSEIGPATLNKFKKLKPWDRDPVKKFIGHQRVELVSVNGDNLPEFEGQVIWVMDAAVSLPLLKDKTMNGVFTIGVQDDKYQNYLAATLIYEDKSADPIVERWRMVQFFVNCQISPLSFSKKLMDKDNFVGRNCN